LFISVPDGGGAPSAGLLTDTETFLTTVSGKPIPLTMDLTVLPALYTTIAIKAIVYIDKDADFNVVKQLVIDNLNTFFSYETRELDSPFDYTIDFERTIRWSRVLDEIQFTQGVKFVHNFEFNSIGQATDMPVAAKTIAALDNSNFDSAYLSGGLEFVVI